MTKYHYAWVDVEGEVATHVIYSTTEADITTTLERIEYECPAGMTWSPDVWWPCELVPGDLVRVSLWNNNSKPIDYSGFAPVFNGGRLVALILKFEESKP